MSNASKTPLFFLSCLLSFIWDCGLADTRCCCRECASCFGEILDKNMLTLSCQHKYCVKCLQNLVALALNDGSHFPPKCCLQEIPKDAILDNVDSSKRKAYNAKCEEYSTPPQDRWYCPLPTCHKWIPPRYVKSKAHNQKCPSCRLPICSSCRGIAHRAPEDCPKKFEPGPAVAEDNTHIGQKECPKCRSLVEMTGHDQCITCRCGTQLWYDLPCSFGRFRYLPTNN